VSAVRYELGSYIPEDGILHSHRRESLTSYILSDLVSYTSSLLVRPCPSDMCHNRNVISVLFLRGLTVCLPYAPCNSQFGTAEVCSYFMSSAGAGGGRWL
jgi:hypothetical protein